MIVSDLERGELKGKGGTDKRRFKATYIVHPAAASGPLPTATKMTTPE